MHVDGYSTQFPTGGNKFFREEGRGSLNDPMRWDESDGPLPLRSGYDNEDDRWNGYVYYTKPHKDGECEAHKPQQGYWEYKPVTNFKLD